jgi:hypothetical protein
MLVKISQAKLAAAGRSLEYGVDPLVLFIVRSAAEPVWVVSQDVL